VQSVEERMEQLEMQAAFNEAEINILSKRLIEQQELIDMLLSGQKKLVEQVESLSEKDDGTGGGVELPPHY
jgi:SlyX protein